MLENLTKAGVKLVEVKCLVSRKSERKTPLKEKKLSVRMRSGLIRLSDGYRLEDLRTTFAC